MYCNKIKATVAEVSSYYENMFAKMITRKGTIPTCVISVIFSYAAASTKKFVSEYLFSFAFVDTSK